MANSNLGNGNLRPETFGKTRQELPLRIAGPLLRPVLGEASYGNVVLSCGVGNHVDLRGLPGGAEGIRTASLSLMCLFLAAVRRGPQRTAKRWTAEAQ